MRWTRIAGRTRCCSGRRSWSRGSPGSTSPRRCRTRRGHGRNRGAARAGGRPRPRGWSGCGGLGMTLGWWADLGFRSCDRGAVQRGGIDAIWCRAPALGAALHAGAGARPSRVVDERAGCCSSRCPPRRAGCDRRAAALRDRDDARNERGLADSRRASPRDWNPAAAVDRRLRVDERGDGRRDARRRAPALALRSDPAERGDRDERAAGDGDEEPERAGVAPGEHARASGLRDLAVQRRSAAATSAPAGAGRRAARCAARRGRSRRSARRRRARRRRSRSPTTTSVAGATAKSAASTPSAPRIATAMKSSPMPALSTGAPRARTASEAQWLRSAHDPRRRQRMDRRRDARRKSSTSSSTRRSTPRPTPRSAGSRSSATSRTA